MREAEIATHVERFRAALQRAGVRQTHQRVAIYREVLAREDHPDVDAVFQSVRVRLPEVSLDTVYRTLWLATDLGLLATLGPRGSKVRFDGDPRPHHHFVCRSCGAVRDFASPALDGLRIPPSIARLGRIESTHVEVRGVCAACAERSPR